ncbi:MAG: aromatic-ring-hydroxylating dioxygenase subunit beta [Betaproteobacteria bacterium]
MSGAAADRFEVEEFLFRYATALDEERFDQWPGFFEENEARYEVLSRENFDLGLPVPIMGCYSHGMIRDRVAMLIQGTLTYRHMYLLRQVTNVRASAGPDGSTTARAGLTVFQSSPEGVSSLYIVARYEADLVRAPDSLKIRALKVIVDSFGIDTMLAVPL